MYPYEVFLSEYVQLDIQEVSGMPNKLSGLYFDNSIRINKRLNRYEKTGVLAEELGHYETTYGDISDLKEVKNKKLEVVARRWGYRKAVPLDSLIDCYKHNYHNIEEICLYLDITPEYLNSALEYYKDKYGIFRIHNGYIIYFDSLNVKKFKLI